MSCGHLYCAAAGHTTCIAVSQYGPRPEDDEPMSDWKQLATPADVEAIELGLYKWVSNGGNGPDLARYLAALNEHDLAQGLGYVDGMREAAREVRNASRRPRRWWLRMRVRR